MSEERGTDPPCPACGGVSYSWGRIRAQQFRFVPDDASFWERYVRGGRRLRGRRCDECGNLQMFDDSAPSRTSERSGDVAEFDFR